MLRAYKYRIYPNKKQEFALAKTFGCVRYFWNKQVEKFNSYNKETNPKPKYKTSTEFRRETKWMQEVSAAVIQQKGIDFKRYKNQRFSKSRKKPIGRPSFKKRNNRQSFRLPNQKFFLEDGYIKLEKISKIKYVQDRPIPENAKFMSVTVSKDTTGKYFASVLVEVETKHFEKTNKTVGIDVGLKEFATLSSGLVISNPRFFRNSQAKLGRAQMWLSKKKKGSSRRRKAKLKVARLHKKIVNQRDWFLHNWSLQIVRDFDIISVEDLNIAGMLKNHKLAKSISDASWAKFLSFIEYKSKWYGKRLIETGRFEPTSKTCSHCGAIKKELSLSERIYECDECGHTEDRDFNSSKNIDAIGVAIAKRA